MSTRRHSAPVWVSSSPRRGDDRGARPFEIGVVEGVEQRPQSGQATTENGENLVVGRVGVLIQSQSGALVDGVIRRRHGERVERIVGLTVLPADPAIVCENEMPQRLHQRPLPVDPFVSRCFWQSLGALKRLVPPRLQHREQGPVVVRGTQRAAELPAPGSAGPTPPRRIPRHRRHRRQPCRPDHARSRHAGSRRTTPRRSLRTDCSRGTWRPPGCRCRTSRR